jgi:hypothetical protein
MSLPQTDVLCLGEKGFEYSISSEANMTCVIIQGYPMPLGYDPPQADLLLRLSAGYPDVKPDMWWFHPAVRDNARMQTRALLIPFRAWRYLRR